MRNLAALIITLVFAVELYLCAAAEQHRKKKPLKGWNVVKGKITGIEKKEDLINKRPYNELEIEVAGGRKVTAKAGIFCIYEIGEEVELQEKEGYHKFLGNDRVGKRGNKELFWGLVPVLVIIGISIICSQLF